MKFHSGTHSGTAVSGLKTANFSIIEKRGKDNQTDISYGEKVIRLGDATMIYNNGSVSNRLNLYNGKILYSIFYISEVLFLINSIISSFRFMSIFGSIVT